MENSLQAFEFILTIKYRGGNLNGKRYRKWVDWHTWKSWWISVDTKIRACREHEQRLVGAISLSVTSFIAPERKKSSGIHGHNKQRYVEWRPNICWSLSYLKHVIGGRELPPPRAVGHSALRWPVWPQLKQAPLEPEERNPPDTADSPVPRLGQSILRCPGCPQLKQFPPEALLIEMLPRSWIQKRQVPPETFGLLLYGCRAIHFAMTWLAAVEAISVC